MAVLFTDDFNRANGPIGANYTIVGPDGFTISGNQVPCTMGNNNIAYVDTVSWPADQYAQCAISGLAGTSTDGPGLLLRCDAAGNNWYWAVINADADITVAERVGGGAISNIATRSAGTWTNGDILKFEIQGTTLKVYKNGVQVGANITDASVATGSAGLAYGSGVDGTIDNFEGGDFVSPPTGVPIAWVRA